MYEFWQGMSNSQMVGPSVVQAKPCASCKVKVSGDSSDGSGHCRHLPTWPKAHYVGMSGWLNWTSRSKANLDVLHGEHEQG